MSPNPDSRPLLSLCMIVKNESQHLERCLASARAYIDEMVVVDTGSQDETPAIAQRFGAKLYSFEWCDDFAAARNFSLEQVTGQWILILDADEELIVENADFRQRLAAQPAVDGYALTRTDSTLLEGDVTGGVHLRLFRNDPNLRYVRRYHEQLQHQDRKALVVDALPDLKILHYGNSDETALLEKTIHRDIPLLEKMKEEEELSFWLLDCLARNYLRTAQPDKAAACYAEAIDRLLPYLLEGEPPQDFFWVPTLMWALGEQALEQEDIETARLLIQRGLEWCANYPPLNYLAGQLLLMLGLPLGAAAYFETCLKLGREDRYDRTAPCPRSFMTVEPACGLGDAYQKMGQWSRAIEAFELALSFDPDCAIARQNLDQLRCKL